jgi:hypothetical protein
MGSLVPGTAEFRFGLRDELLHFLNRQVESSSRQSILATNEYQSKNHGKYHNEFYHSNIYYIMIIHDIYHSESYLLYHSEYGKSHGES